MNCIFLFLLLCCCGAGGDGRSGSCGSNGTSSANSGCGCSSVSAPGTGSNIRGGFPTLNSGRGCQEETAYSDDCGCREDGQSTCAVFDGNPVNWQEHPEVSRGSDCSCDN